jgi:hypothetical protein
MLTWTLVILGAQLAAAQAPPKKFEALDRTARRTWQVKPGQTCAIPLLNVLRPEGATTVKPDPMIIMPKGPMANPWEEVKVPAPACDDVKKDAEKK